MFHFSLSVIIILTEHILYTADFNLKVQQLGMHLQGVF